MSAKRKIIRSPHLVFVIVIWIIPMSPFDDYASPPGVPTGLKEVQRRHYTSSALLDVAR